MWHTGTVCICARLTAAKPETNSLDLTDIDAICVCGGDGTVFEVVNGLMQRFTRDGEAIPPLCVVPLGTSNASGDALGFFVEGKFDVCVRNAIEAMAAGRVTDPDCLMIDLGNSTVIYACQSLTWGAINDVLYTTDWYASCADSAGACSRMLRAVCSSLLAFLFCELFRPAAFGAWGHVATWSAACGS